MRRRQTAPVQWLIIADQDVELAIRLPRGSGILLLASLTGTQMPRLRRIARQRGLTVVEEGPRSAVRVHDNRELRRAMLRRTPLILISPLHPTRSHPDWKPIPRMRAAALARLGGRRVIALGGMDSRRYARIADLGFQGWAGISAFRT